MLVAGPFERGPAAKSTRAELYGYECDEYIENASVIRTHTVKLIGSIVSLMSLYYSPCIQTLTLQSTRKHDEVMMIAPIRMGCRIHLSTGSQTETTPLSLPNVYNALLYTSQFSLTKRLAESTSLLSRTF